LQIKISLFFERFADFVRILCSEVVSLSTQGWQRGIASGASGQRLKWMRRPSERLGEGVYTFSPMGSGESPALFDFAGRAQPAPV